MAGFSGRKPLLNLIHLKNLMHENIIPLWLFHLNPLISQFIFYLFSISFLFIFNFSLILLQFIFNLFSIYFNLFSFYISFWFICIFSILPSGSCSSWWIWLGARSQLFELCLFDLYGSTYVLLFTRTWPCRHSSNHVYRLS